MNTSFYLFISNLCLKKSIYQRPKEKNLVFIVSRTDWLLRLLIETKTSS